VIKNSIIYILTGAFSALIPILLMPFLIQNLAPQDYGLITLFSTCQLFLLPILGFSSNSAVSRQFFDSSINLSVYIGNYFYILFGSVFLILSLFFLFDNFIISMTGLSSIWLCLVLICSIAQNIIATRLSLFQVSERANRFLLFQCINISLNIALTYFLISTFNYGKDGRIYAITFSAIFLGIVSVYSLKSEGLIDLKLNITYLKDAIKYSTPLIFHSTAGSIMGMSDRFLITKLISLEATGIYSVAFQIGGALNLISTGINNAFIPWLFKKLSDEQFDRKILIRYTYIFYLFLWVHKFLVSNIYCFINLF
jgi:O-antigen/teichoic acid export membrane protein